MGFLDLLKTFLKRSKGFLDVHRTFTECPRNVQIIFERFLYVHNVPKVFYRSLIILKGSFQVFKRFKTFRKRFLNVHLERFINVQNLPQKDVFKRFDRTSIEPTWNVLRTFRKRPIVSWVVPRDCVFFLSIIFVFNVFIWISFNQKALNLFGEWRKSSVKITSFGKKSVYSMTCVSILTLTGIYVL